MKGTEVCIILGLFDVSFNCFTEIALVLKEALHLKGGEATQELVLY